MDLIAKSGHKGNVMSHQQMEYEAIMRAAGHRVTPQRVCILDAVCEAQGHTPLGAIYERVHRDDPSIDRSTLYRTLKLFVRLGLVVSAETADGETVYEIVQPRQHHHLVCRTCGKEQQVDDALFQPVFDVILAQHQFVVETNHLVLFGVCSACQANTPPAP